MSLEPRTRHGRYVHTLSKLHTYPAFDVNDIIQIEEEAAALPGLRGALAEWDAIEGADLADQFRAFIAAGSMADAIRAVVESRGETT